MNRLFISLYLDEDASVLIAKLIRSRACTVLTTQEPDQIGQSDDEQLTFVTARRAKRTHGGTVGRGGQWAFQFGVMPRKP